MYDVFIFESIFLEYFLFIVAKLSTEPNILMISLNQQFTPRCSATTQHCIQNKPYSRQYNQSPCNTRLRMIKRKRQSPRFYKVTLARSNKLREVLPTSFVKRSHCWSRISSLLSKIEQQTETTLYTILANNPVRISTPLTSYPRLAYYPICSPDGISTPLTSYPRLAYYPVMIMKQGGL